MEAEVLMVQEIFYLAFFGTPSATGKFEIMFTGHHKTIANTYNNGALVAATPLFTATEPLSFAVNSTTYAPVDQEKCYCCFTWRAFFHTAYHCKSQYNLYGSGLRTYRQLEFPDCFFRAAVFCFGCDSKSTGTECN
jgi:hypothetical protein